VFKWIIFLIILKILIRQNLALWEIWNLINFFLGQIFSHFSDAIIQFLMIAIILNMVDKAGSAIAITFFSFFATAIFNIAFFRNLV